MPIWIILKLAKTLIPWCASLHQVSDLGGRAESRSLCPSQPIRYLWPAASWDLDWSILTRSWNSSHVPHGPFQVPTVLYEGYSDREGAWGVYRCDKRSAGLEGSLSRAHQPRVFRLFRKLEDSDEDASLSSFVWSIFLWLLSDQIRLDQTNISLTSRCTLAFKFLEKA